jgi:hypothetical protein
MLYVSERGKNFAKNIHHHIFFFIILLWVRISVFKGGQSLSSLNIVCMWKWYVWTQLISIHSNSWHVSISLCHSHFLISIFFYSTMKLFLFFVISYLLLKNVGFFLDLNVRLGHHQKTTNLLHHLHLIWIFFLSFFLFVNITVWMSVWIQNRNLIKLIVSTIVTRT